jgi:hypothetical protein
MGGRSLREKGLRLLLTLYLGVLWVKKFRQESKPPVSIFKGLKNEMAAALFYLLRLLS